MVLHKITLCDNIGSSRRNSLAGDLDERAEQFVAMSLENKMKPRIRKSMKKKSGYNYTFNGVVVRSPKKIYLSKNTYCHKQGDFLVPISPNLLFKIEMAKLNGADKLLEVGV